MKQPPFRRFCRARAAAALCAACVAVIPAATHAAEPAVGALTLEPTTSATLVAPGWLARAEAINRRAALLDRLTRSADRPLRAPLLAAPAPSLADRASDAPAARRVEPVSDKDDAPAASLPADDPRPAGYAFSGFAPNIPATASYSPARFAAEVPATPARRSPSGIVTRALPASSTLPVVTATGTLPTALSATVDHWTPGATTLVGHVFSDSPATLRSTPATTGGNGAAVRATDAFSNNAVLPNATVASINRIADTTTTGPGQSSAFTSFSSFPYVSNSRVTFIGTTGTPKGVYVGTVGSSTITRVADYSFAVPTLGGTFNGFGVSSSINTAGVAVFQGNSSAGGTGIYVGTGGNSSVQRIADTMTTAPGKTFLFTAFTTPDIDGNNVSLTGTANGSAGVYVGTVDNSAPLTRIVDTSFIAPGKGVAFTAISFSAISGNRVSFGGTANGSLGFYSATYAAGNNTPTLTRLVDTASTVPNQGVAFTSFQSNQSISGNQVAFSGSFGTAGTGVYTVATDGTGLTRVIDTTMNAPGKGTLLTGTSSPSISNGNVAFLGTYGSSTASSIYVALVDGTFLDVVDSGSAFGGSTFSSFSLSKFALEGSQVSFSYTLANGVQGIGEAELSLVPEPGTWAGGALLLGAAGWTLRRQRRSVRA